MKKTLSLLALISATFLPSAIHAGSIGDTYLQAGVGYARFDTGSDKLDMMTGRIEGNYALWNLGFMGIDLRADYMYGGDTDSNLDAHLQQGRIEALAYANVLGILKPYVTAGGVYAESDYPTNTGNVDYSQGGYSLSAGVQIGVLPDLLYITPSYRYTNAGSRDGNTYRLDATLWITYIGVGAYVSYEDLQHVNADLVEAGAYVSFRF
ncbi:MAG: outer membrane beta-barrel protein [Puniceicoccales bacterium]|jgi:hypothetical protein|nr:outer membrane beta-barrel protein [Puniceicoccales bacterium]